jgi:hypothetical protein
MYVSNLNLSLNQINNDVYYQQKNYVVNDLGIKSNGFFEISEISWENTTVADVYVEGNICYLACFSEGIKILNISDILNPILIADFYDGGIAQSLTKRDNYLVVADSNQGIEIFDIGNLPTITKVESFWDGGTALKVGFYYDYLLVADGPDGLEIFDASNLAAISKINSFKTSTGSASATSFSINEAKETIILGYGRQGIFYLSFSDPENLIQVGQRGFSEDVSDIYTNPDSSSYTSWVALKTQGIDFVVWTGSYWNSHMIIKSEADSGLATSVTPYLNGVIVSDGYDGIEYQYVAYNKLVRNSYYYDGGWALNSYITEYDSFNFIFVADSNDGLEIIGKDSDNDFLADFSENYYSTDEENPDTDGDGYLDGLEIIYSTDPLDNKDYPEIVISTPPVTTLPTIPSPNTSKPEYPSFSSATSPYFGIIPTIGTLSLITVIIMIYSRKKKEK